MKSPLEPKSFRCAARAAPYEKGTETGIGASVPDRGRGAARAAPYEKGTETHRAR